MANQANKRRKLMSEITEECFSDENFGNTKIIISPDCTYYAHRDILKIWSQCLQEDDKIFTDCLDLTSYELDKV